MDGVKLLVSPQDAAAALSIGRSKVFELLAAGELASVKIGRRRLIPRQALDQYIERLREEAGLGASVS